jgi:hypothetical membrane protein
MNPQENAADIIVPRIPAHVSLMCWGLSGAILFNIVYFAFGAVTPNYDEMRQPIGNLELVSHGWIQSANFIALGLSLALFAVGLRKELAGGFGATMLPLLHFLTAFGLILMGIFIHEPAHTYVSFFSFFSILVSFLLFARRFSDDPGWEKWIPFTNICAIIMLVLMVIFWYTDDNDGSYAGVFERMLEITRLIWSIFFMLKLLDGGRLKIND